MVEARPQSDPSPRSRWRSVLLILLGCAAGYGATYAWRYLSALSLAWRTEAPRHLGALPPQMIHAAQAPLLDVHLLSCALGLAAVTVWGALLVRVVRRRGSSAATWAVLASSLVAFALGLMAGRGAWMD